MVGLRPDEGGSLAMVVLAIAAGVCLLVCASLVAFLYGIVFAIEWLVSRGGWGKR